jgi:hypothetical protein
MSGLRDTIFGTTSRLVNGDEPIRDRVLRQLSRRSHAELPHDACFVKLDGFDRHVQYGRHFFDGFSFSHELQHFPLSQAERVSESFGGFFSVLIGEGMYPLVGDDG